MRLLQFVKEWTLPVAMVVGTVVYFLFAFTPALEGAAAFFGPIIDDIFPLFMFLILFVTFCKVDFRQLRPVAWHFWVGAFQVLFVVIIAAIILAFHLKGDKLILMESLLTCIIGPCAAAAAVVTSKLGGNLEEMTSYTFISNFLTALMVPVCFPLIDSTVGMDFLHAFWLILYKVCLVLVVPMALAFVVKHYIHTLHQWIVSVKDLSFYLWGVSLAIVTGTTVKNIVHADTSARFLCLIAGMGLLICLVQFAVGRYLGHFFNHTQEAGQALGQKNTNFAIWIAYTYLNPIASVGPGCYILWQNVINSIELWQHQRSKQQQLQAPPSSSSPSPPSSPL
ncbi:MAG: transporter [Prevotella sp.]|nr:transporter [Prevotella sp.]